MLSSDRQTTSTVWLRLGRLLVLFGFLLNITNSLGYLLKSVLVVGVGDLKI